MSDSSCRFYARQSARQLARQTARQLPLLRKYVHVSLVHIKHHHDLYHSSRVPPWLRRFSANHRHQLKLTAISTCDTVFVACHIQCMKLLHPYSIEPFFLLPDPDDGSGNHLGKAFRTTAQTNRSAKPRRPTKKLLGLFFPNR